MGELGRVPSNSCVEEYKIHQYFLQAITNAIQQVVQRPCTNCKELSNSIGEFHVLFKNIQRKIATKVLSSLVLSTALENFICARSIQKYLNMLQSYSLGCSLANRDTKDHIVMHIRLIARSAL